MIDFGHGEMDPKMAELLSSGTANINGVVYTIKSVDLAEQFTDPTLQPTYGVCVEIANHPSIEKGNYFATGTLRQCVEYITSL